jgi:hypothetical protein
MTLSKIILTFLISFIAASFCAAQEKPQAVLVDKTDDCCISDRLRGRIINFLQELQKDPGSQGLAIIDSEENISPASFFFFNEIMGRPAYHRFPLDRLTIIRAKKLGKTAIEFWKIPARADMARVAYPWPYELPADTKPFKLGNTFREDGFELSFDLCAGFLKGNPGFHGNIAVYDKSPRKARIEGRRWVKTLTEKYRIPRSQLRVFYAKAKHFDGGGGHQPYSDVEFWLVPSRTSTAKVALPPVKAG